MQWRLLEGRMVLILPNIVHRLVSEYLYWFEPPQIDSSSMKTFLEGKISSTAREGQREAGGLSWENRSPRNEKINCVGNELTATVALLDEAN